MQTLHHFWPTFFWRRLGATITCNKKLFERQNSQNAFLEPKYVQKSYFFAPLVRIRHFWGEAGALVGCLGGANRAFCVRGVTNSVESADTALLSKTVAQDTLLSLAAPGPDSGVGRPADRFPL